MRKMILALFIILFCFSFGIAELQEEELSKEEMAALEKALEISGNRLEILERLVSLSEEIEKLKKELADLRKQDKELKEKTKGIIDWEAMFAESEEEPEEYDFSFLDGIEPLPDHIKPLEEKKKEDLSWEEKYRIYPSTKYWLDSLGVGKTDADKLEEENDRLEVLLDEISSERFNLEQDMMMHRWEIEDAKPKPWDYQMAAEQAIENAMFDMMMWPELVVPPLLTRFYYPGYVKKKERTNYEPLLFTLCTDSKGKMDWTKYGWLKIWLRNK